MTISARIYLETVCFYCNDFLELLVCAAMKAMALEKTKTLERIRNEFNARRAHNSRYSLRAFSNLVRVPAGHLSQILSGKRPLTQKMAVRIGERLGFSGAEKHAAVTELESYTRNRKALKQGARLTHYALKYQQINEDTLAVIADWHHFALLSLIETFDFNPQEKWIAQRLGIFESEVRVALERLLRLGLVKREEETLIPTNAALCTSSGIPSEALRHSHKQSIRQALAAYDDTPFNEFDITSITMAIDPKKIPHAKVLIQNFRRYLASVLETGERSEVYNLNVQLVPVTRKRKENEKISQILH